MEREIQVDLCSVGRDEVAVPDRCGEGVELKGKDQSIQTLTCVSDSQSGFYKGCASDWYCEAAGYLYVSFSYGSNYLYYNLTCCNTNECNTPNLPEPPVGSLQCYSCDSDTYNCTSTMTCRDQELCFQTNYKNSTKTIHGCASEYLCSDSELSQSYFDGPLSCCNTSLCNGPGLAPA
ncbi:hypothetical protein WMY93_032409 [Mugilogobius chulae]|uniref:Snake toxin/toxin-like domain-containing protein n=1 Tax=Mugilogobius chulae TaxID=88201 RepID=A0AAW0MP74_9GOBI